MREREQKFIGGDMRQTEMRGFEEGTTSQEMWAPQEFKKGKNGFPAKPEEGAQPRDPLVLALQAGVGRLTSRTVR